MLKMKKATTLKIIHMHVYVGTRNTILNNVLLYCYCSGNCLDAKKLLKRKRNVAGVDGNININVNNQSCGCGSLPC